MWEISYSTSALSNIPCASLSRYECRALRLAAAASGGDAGEGGVPAGLGLWGHTDTPAGAGCPLRRQAGDGGERRGRSPFGRSRDPARGSAARGEGAKQQHGQEQQEKSTRQQPQQEPPQPAHRPGPGAPGAEEVELTRHGHTDTRTDTRTPRSAPGRPGSPGHPTAPPAPLPDHFQNSLPQPPALSSPVPGAAAGRAEPGSPARSPRYLVAVIIIQRAEASGVRAGQRAHGGGGGGVEPNVHAGAAGGRRGLQRAWTRLRRRRCLWRGERAGTGRAAAPGPPRSAPPRAGPLLFAGSSRPGARAPLGQRRRSPPELPPNAAARRFSLPAGEPVTSSVPGVPSPDTGRCPAASFPSAPRAHPLMKDALRRADPCSVGTPNRCPIWNP